MKSLQLKDAHDLLIKKQIDLPGGEVVPKNSKIVKVNGEDATTELLDGCEGDTVTITYEEPSEPPALPDYMVIKVDGYADLGGPPFFPEEEMRDYVAIPRRRGRRQNVDGKTSQNNKQTRLSFHLEGGDSES